MPERSWLVFLQAPGPIPMDRLLDGMAAKGQHLAWTNTLANKQDDLVHWTMGTLTRADNDAEQVAIVFDALEEEDREEMLEAYEAEEPFLEPLGQAQAQYRLSFRTAEQERLAARLLEVLLAEGPAVIRDVEAECCYTAEEFRKAKPGLFPN